MESLGPVSRYYFSQRLRLHYVDWGNAGAPALLLVHGGRDHCRSWDWVAQALRHDFHVIAVDLRGSGDSAWATGGSYPVSDFVYDIAQLARQEKLERFSLMAHSMGGVGSLLYAGAYPETVDRLVVVEGLLMPPQDMKRREAIAPQARLTDWVKELHTLSARGIRRYAALEDAIGRMRSENPRLSEHQARHLTVHGMNQNEDGSFSWKFDPYIVASKALREALPLRSEDIAALWSNIACPTLLIRGGESFVGDPETDGSIAHFRDARSVTIQGAGHWVFHDKLEEFIGHVRPFLAR
ncbi:alpha/beta hydrolase [Variovorax defluvii]|uniref:Alpha/beta hydrolase n=1 Tax=Variovorax defluvii TaxID=913761 RepID=A0ABP8I8W8_9BURK